MKVKRAYELIQFATREKTVEELTSPLTDEEKGFVESAKKQDEEAKRFLGHFVWSVPDNYDDCED